MEKNRRPRAATQAETRERLLDAAEHLFGEHGFHGTSVAQIAAEAGYTTGAIYSNFERKEDLAAEVLARNGGVVHRSLADAADPDHDFIERLVAILGWRAEHHERRRATTILRLDLWSISRHDPALRETLVTGRQRLRSMFASLLDEQARAGGVTSRIPIEDLAAMLIAAADGTSATEVIGGAGTESLRYTWMVVTLINAAMEPSPLEPDEIDDVVARIHGAEPA